MNGTNPPPYKMLIIDDEGFVRDILRDLFSERFECTTAASAAEALATVENERFSIVLSDIDLGDMSGIEVVPRVLKQSPDTVVIMISGNQTIDVAIEAMRVGAFDYIRKPFEIDFVELAVKRAFDHHKLLAGKR
ncbi:MAG TPA: response regulator, partial [Pyrinomonadaceae bacterium]|nr:response regulator [Pyrinomonadaceae bacterium]